MVQVTFVHQDKNYVVQGDAGQSLMQIALDQQVPGILADCGGCVTCGTCHTFVAAPWADRFPPPTEDEQIMVDGLLNSDASSRLACRLFLSPELDGLVVRLPDSQL